jgi:hypothetical protein
MGRSKLSDGARQKLTVVAKDRHDQRAAAARNQREGFILAPVRDDGRNRSEHLGIVHRARLVGCLDLEQRRRNKSRFCTIDAVNLGALMLSPTRSAKADALLKGAEAECKARKKSSKPAVCSPPRLSASSARGRITSAAVSISMPWQWIFGRFNSAWKNSRQKPDDPEQSNEGLDDV